MGTVFYIVFVCVVIYFIVEFIKVNIIHPEQGKQMREDAKATKLKREQAMFDKDGILKCPICGSKQIQMMKRGWKITTGFIGSNKNERVCMACKHKF